MTDGLDLNKMPEPVRVFADAFFALKALVWALRYAKDPEGTVQSARRQQAELGLPDAPMMRIIRQDPTMYAAMLIESTRKLHFIYPAIEGYEIIKRNYEAGHYNLMTIAATPYLVKCGIEVEKEV